MSTVMKYPTMEDRWELRCIGRDGVHRTFMYWVEREITSDEWVFFVTTPEPLPSGELFQLTLTSVDRSTVRVTMMNAHNEPAYHGAGIPDAVLPEAARLLGRNVVSSRNKGERPGSEYRTASATKVWERLRSRGLAVYDAATDTYWLSTGRHGAAPGPLHRPDPLPGLGPG
jgi:hypothetical protein